MSIGYTIMLCGVLGMLIPKPWNWLPIFTGLILVGVHIGTDPEIRDWILKVKKRVLELFSKGRVE